MRWATKATALLVALLGSASAHAVAINVERLPVIELVRLYYTECDKGGFIVTAKGLDTPAQMSGVTGDLTCDQLSAVLDVALRDSGLTLQRRDGPDAIVGRADGASGSVSAPADVDRSSWETLVYQPKYREADDLVQTSGFLVHEGQFGHRSEGFIPRGAGESRVTPTGGNGASMHTARLDRIVFYGPKGEIAALKALWAQLDTAVPAVEIRVGVYEFGEGGAKGSAIAAVTQVLSSSVRLDLGARLDGNSLEVDIGDFTAVLSALDRDSRFRYVAQPRVIVSDGEPARFFAGEDARVTGAIIVDGNGNPVQSREVLSAGVTLEVTPRIAGEAVSLDLYQAISQFTSAGEDPSVLRRDVRTSLPVTPGKVYVVAGLDANRSAQGNQRLFGLKLGRTRDHSSSELVLLLSVTRVNG